MKPDRALSSVVLPLPVPPEIRMLRRALDAGAQERRSISGVIVPMSTQVVHRAAAVRRSGGWRRQRAVEGQRRDDGVDAAAVGQAGIHHRLAFVDAPADLSPRCAR